MAAPANPDVIVPMSEQQVGAPVHFGFSSDFKSAALWALLGVVGGMMLMHYLSGKKGGGLF